MTQTPSHDDPRDLYTAELPRRRDAIRAEEVAARTGQLPLVSDSAAPASGGPEAASGGSEAASGGSEAASGGPGSAAAAQPVSAPAREPASAPARQQASAPARQPVSAYGHGLVTAGASPVGTQPGDAPDPDASDAMAAAGAAGANLAAAAGAKPVEKDYGRAGRNLPAAFAVGLTLGGAVLASLLFYPPSFVFVVLIGVVAAMWELANALSRSGSVVARIPTVTAAGLMILATYFSGREALWVTFTVGAGAILLFTLLEQRPNPVKDVCLSLFALTYVGLMASAVVYILTLPVGNLLVILFLALVVSSDIGGYMFGVLWGRHPIAPRISPKKSWEGYAGSALFSTAVGVTMALLLFDAPIWTGVVLGTVIPAFATLGDFSESMIKRDLDLKDMGTLLPGHGGVMDRLDSILPTAPIALVLFTFLPGFIT